MAANSATPMMTAAQVAAELQVTAPTVYQYIRSKALKAGYLPGRGLRVRRADFDAFVEDMFGVSAAEMAAHAQAMAATAAEVTHLHSRSMSAVEHGRRRAVARASRSASGGLIGQE